MTLTSTYDHRVIQGAAVRRVPAASSTSCCSARTASTTRSSRRCASRTSRSAGSRTSTSSHDDDVTKAARVFELIHSYRVRGHVMADTDPLEYKQRKHPDLDIIEHGLTLWDLEREFAVGGFAGKSMMKLRDILGVLRDSYCRTIGIEYMHIQDPKQRKWIQDRVERPHAKPEREEQLRILRRLNAAEAFETFLQTKYVGQKRFSLEGGESVIPLLDAVIDAAAESRLDEVVIGMAHRGRLNVLANIVGKSVRADLPRVRGQPRPEVDARLRRREVPPRRRGHLHRPGRRADQGLAGRQPLPPGDRRPGRSRASPAPSRTSSTRAARTSPSCRCSCTATRPSRARAWSPRR